MLAYIKKAVILGILNIYYNIDFVHTPIILVSLFFMLLHYFRDKNTKHVQKVSSALCCLFLTPFHIFRHAPDVLVFEPTRPTVHLLITYTNSFNIILP